MSNKLISIGLMLVLMWPLAANDLKDSSLPNSPGKDLVSLPGIGEDLVIYSNSSSDQDIVAAENNAIPGYIPSGFNRGTDDTLAYVPADGGWNAYFYGYQAIGDAFMTCFQMPADGILKGVNVPIYFWGSGDQQITISLHKLSYPYGTDGAMYSTANVDGGGWLGGYDMDATTGWMTSSGSEYTAGGTAGVCNEATAVIAAAQDPLGTTDGTGPTGVPSKGLIWPDGFTAATGNPETQPAEDNSVWYATADYGSEPELMAGDWVGILVQGSGAGGGDDPTLGFYYEAADGLVDNWVGLKFYGECGGTSGNGGWHIRHWMFNMSLAVELTGDRGPVFVDVGALPTTLSQDDRAVSAHVTDDNPSGEAAGVSAVTLSYQLDSLTATVNSVSLSMTDGSSEDGTWEGTMPGAATGQTVYWTLTAYDNNGNASSTAMTSYFIFEATAGNDLIFNNQARLYGSLAYSAQLYFYWAALSATGFDIWDASYGGMNDELTGQYSTIVELAGTGPNYINDAEVTSWWAGGDKLYIVAGDEWLGARSGWANGETAAGSVAREVLGIAAEYNDVNYGAAGDQEGISRLMALDGDAYSGPLYAFMQNANTDSSMDSTGAAVMVTLNYDPFYETGGSNWLDGVDAVASHTVNMTGLSGVLDSTGAPLADAETYNVMISGQSGTGGRSAFLAFDPIALNTQYMTPHDVGYVWVGAHNYSGANVSPLALAYEGLGASTGTDDEIAMPNSFALRGNYPNPFNPSTKIAYSIDINSKVNVKIYSLLGEEITSLFSGDVNPGTHEVQWNGTDNAGVAVASGVYIYRVEANNQALTSKMMLLK